MTVRWTTEEEFWQAAARNAPLLFRLLRWSLTTKQVDAEIGQYSAWVELKKMLLPGDLIWPFEMNRRTLAYRKGFVAIRRRKPMGGVVTLVS